MTNPDHDRAGDWWLVLLFVIALALLSGCAASGQGPSPAVVIKQAEDEIATQKQRLATLPPDHPGRVEAEKVIASLESKLTEYKANVEAQEKAGVHPDDAAAIGAVQVVSKFAGPFGAIADVAALLLIPTIGGWIRASRRAKAGEELATAVKEVAIANGGTIDFADDGHRDQLKAATTERAKALVDRVGAKVPRIREKAKTKKATTKPKAKPKKAATGATS